MVPLPRGPTFPACERWGNRPVGTCSSCGRQSPAEGMMTRRIKIKFPRRTRLQEPLGFAAARIIDTQTEAAYLSAPMESLAKRR